MDAFAELRIVDYGDAPVLPADPASSAVAIERTVGEVLEAGLIPIVLGGDHSIAEPDIAACAARHGPVGLVHFDTHTDTGTEVFGVEVSHGTPMYRLVRSGAVDPKRYVQIGLRGYWPGEREFAWQAEQGITAIFMHEVRDDGIDAVVERAVDLVGARAGLSLRRRRRARSRFRARHGNAGAGRHDEHRSAQGGPRSSPSGSTSWEPTSSR